MGQGSAVIIMLHINEGDPNGELTGAIGDLCNSLDGHYWVNQDGAETWEQIGGNAPGSPKITAFPFTFDTPNLATGAVMTDSIPEGDLLLDAWVQLDTEWNGTTPLMDYGPSGELLGLTGTWGGGPLDVGTGTADQTVGGTYQVGSGRYFNRNQRLSDSITIDWTSDSSFPGGGIFHSPAAVAEYPQRILPLKWISNVEFLVWVSRDGTAFNNYAYINPDTIVDLPVTITEGVNDQFVFTGLQTSEAPVTYTMAPGVYTTFAALLAAMQQALDSLSAEFIGVANPIGLGGGNSSCSAEASLSLPMVIATGVNDTFVYTPISTGIPETFTIAPGSYSSAAACAGAMHDAVGTDSDIFGDYGDPQYESPIVIAANAVFGSGQNGDTITEGNGGASSLGFFGTTTFAGGLDYAQIQLDAFGPGIAYNGDQISEGNGGAAALGFTSNPDVLGGGAGGDPGATQGAAVLYLMTCTPAT
jgi:hypothetical protein